MAVAPRVDSAHSAGQVTSEILDRLPPQNLDAERAVLGSLILNPHCLQIPSVKPQRRHDPDQDTPSRRGRAKYRGCQAQRWMSITLVLRQRTCRPGPA